MRIHPLLFACALALSGSVAAQSAVEQAQARSAAKAAAAKAAEEKAAAEKAAADKAAADKAAAEKAAQAAPAAKVYRDGVIKVGDEMKETRGRVTDVDRGDNGCYITFRNEKNSEMIELGKFELCTQKPSFKGKQVELEYRMETVQAASCYGDPKCKMTETVPLVVSVKVLD